MRTLVAGALLFHLVAVAGFTADAPPTRGVGVYPGDPREDFAPQLVSDAATYRNLALHRAAYQSSSYDYNLTAQLVTDGIRATERPGVVAVTTGHGGVVPRPERELAFDHSIVSNARFDGAGDWWQVELAGGAAPPAVDRVEISVRTRRDEGQSAASGEWSFTLATSEDGRAWKEAGHARGQVPPVAPLSVGESPSSFPRYQTVNPLQVRMIALPAATRARFYRVTLDATGGEDWGLAEVAFYAGEQRVEVGGPYSFASAWMSAGGGEQWVSVDLGAPSTFDRIVLQWLLRADAGEVQVSDDGAAWRTLQPLAAASGLTETIALAAPAQGRYVRILMRKPVSPEGYALAEVEVYGRGGLVPRAQPAPAAEGGRQTLAGGAWRVQRDSLVSVDGAALSRAGFADADWIVATVPGTVLSSYWNAGALPDPNFGDNQLAISESFFHADFWYRTEFETPRVAAGKHVFLNFDGIAWKAEVFLNGERLGRIEGSFCRGRFDVSRSLRPGKNALAVRIEKHRTPGSTKEKTLDAPGLNGGALGADDPTFHAAVGWDWIPPIRGRNIGIWGAVSLTTSGPVTIDDPAVRTVLPLPNVAPADVTIAAVLANHDTQPVRGVLRGTLGTVSFEEPVTLAGGATREVVLDPRTHPQLRLAQPRLWWPNGYGDPYLYPMTLQFVAAGGGLSDARSFPAGLRQLTYSEDGGALRIWVNGRRFVARGGNWGFPESNLRYRAREYDVAVRHHRAMNFTMIRNWVGQTPDDAFYEACDRHGILIWQDFWLANPWDGPDPDDPDLFLRNARDTIRRIRVHPSIGLYCGRNEGDPPPVIEAGLRAALAELHPDLHYIPNSAEGPVSGHGPYWAESPRFYFEERATTTLHSEMGMPDIVGTESLRQMMPPSWPPDATWGLHDFNLKGAQKLAAFRAIVDDGYGGSDDRDTWLSLAQFVNYDGYRAMFEAQSRNRMGLLLWMSHPAWPSFVWQTYDYYFDPTAGYFGSKKGAEPLHIQWNAANDTVEVVNYSGGRAAGLTAEAEVLNMDGSRQWQARADVDSDEDSVVAPITIEAPAGVTPVHFIRLRLLRGSELVSQNFYWRGREPGRYQALRTLPRVAVEATTRRERRGDRYQLETDLRNTSATPALMVRLVPVRSVSRDRILPAFLDDNFVALMPGETRTIRTEIAVADARGEEPDVRVEGFNVTSGREADAAALAKARADLQRTR